MHHPIRDSDHDTFNITFNWTYQDYDDDYSMQKIYIDRGDGNIPTLLYRSFDKNGTYNFLWDGNMTYINTSDDSLYGYWKFDNDEKYGAQNYNNYASPDLNKHYPLEPDYSGNERHATYDNRMSTSNAHFNESGFLAGSYDFDATNDFLKIGNATEFNDLYQGTGFAVSAWINTRLESNLISQYAVAKYNPSDYDRFFAFGLTTTYVQNDSNRPFIHVYSDGTTSPSCFASPSATDGLLG